MTKKISMDEWNKKWIPKLKQLPNPNEGNFLMIYQVFSGRFKIGKKTYSAIAWQPPGEKPYVIVTKERQKK